MMAVNGIRCHHEVTKAPGFDTIDLTRRVESAIDELQANLPDIRLEPLFRQSDFIENAVGNLKEAILDGGIMVSCPAFSAQSENDHYLDGDSTVFRLHITLVPSLGLSVNSMTLGGLAVAIGIVVDDATVDVEKCARRLRKCPLRSPHLI